LNYATVGTLLSIFALIVIRKKRKITQRLAVAEKVGRILHMTHQLITISMKILCYVCSNIMPY